MAQDPPASYTHRVEAVLRVLGGQWVVAILSALAVGQLNYVSILKKVNVEEQRASVAPRRLHNKVLTETLQRMEERRLILRHDLETAMPSVIYELTPTGRSLLASIRPLAEWSAEHWNELATEQDRDVVKGT